MKPHVAFGDDKIAYMAEGGRRLGRILSALLSRAQPGVRLIDLDTFAQKEIRKAGGTPSFMTVEGYKWATCLCVNDVVVHGVPTDDIVLQGDLLTIDIGMVYKGFHTDTAWTKVVHGEKYKVHSFVQAFLKAGQTALARAIQKAVVGNRIGHISQALQTTIEAEGYSIVKSLVGHGVGRKLHESPQIPGFVRGSISRTEPIVPGMTLAIEAIYTMGGGAVTYDNSDGWSVTTKDKSLSAVFEHTVTVGNKPGEKAVVLTKVAS